ncbi:MAG TPA: PaaI family thioesterase [Ramlibacter sp.]|nr:PaaI family thioesterase [Ramlibacter sp.]
MADLNHQPAPPEGFERMPTFGPFHEAQGPMYSRLSDGVMTVGMWVQDKHRNRLQMMHGGMVCTLADTATHWAARHTRQPKGSMLTTNLSVSLMGNAAPGEWVEARVKVLRAGRSVVFTHCEISCEDRVIAQATAQFQVLDGAAMPPLPAVQSA